MPEQKSSVYKTDVLSDYRFIVNERLFLDAERRSETVCLFICQIFQCISIYLTNLLFLRKLILYQGLNKFNTHMIRKITLLFLACCSAVLSAKAQRLCGFDAIHQHMMATNPVYNQSIQQNAFNWAQHMQSLSNPNALIINTAGGTVYEIPVVVHVMNTGGAVGTLYNPSDAQVLRMIDYLNKSYAAKWIGYPDSTTGGAYIPLRFKLAQRSPGCAATTGIDRFTVTNAQYVSSGVNSNINGNVGGLDDTTLKNYDRWPTHDYYNIWVVNKIDGVDGTQPGQSFIAGFAYFAGAPDVYDGTIMLASVADSGDITLPHEIGHAMGLYHTFQGGTTSTCPANNNCNTDGDEVCDTEPMKQYSPGSCPTGTNPCTNAPWQNTQKNFMNYSNCQDRFTPGQRTKVLYNLQSLRSSLLSSLGATPLSGTAPQTACTPTITNAGNQADAGPRSVQLNDLLATSGGYTTDGYKVLYDRTCLQRANLVIGGTYNITVQTGQFNNENCRAYIDYDNNGIFAANELILSSNNSTAHTATFTVPQTGQTVLTCTPLRMRVISDITNNAGQPIPCGTLAYGQAEDFSVYIKPIGTNSSVSISVNTNPSCLNSAITFTGTPAPNAVNPTYQWYVNNAPVAGATNATYTTSTIANNSAVRLLMFYSTAVGCGGVDSVYSNTIYVSRVSNLTATVSITTPTNPACAGQPMTFTAAPVNGGTAPTYQWYVNNVLVAGVTGNVYTAPTGLNAGDQVKVVMASNAACVSANATSNVITVAHTGTLTPAVAITATGNPGCPGQTISFTATPTNGGTAPTYQWRQNGTAITGATNSTFSSSTLNNGDIITVQMVSNNPCATTTPVTSNAVTISFAVQTAAINIAVTTGTNPSCEGKSVTFTASATNPGTTPTYDWKINGTSTGTNAITYTSSTLVTGDVVTCTLTSSNACVTNPVVTSNAISMEVDKVDTTSVTTTLTAGTNPGCSDSMLTYVANAVNMGANPNYTWYVNGNPVSNGATYSSNTLADGDILTVRAIASGAGCRTQDTVYSAQIAIVRLPTPGAPVISLIGTLLVANTSASVQWYGPNGLIPGATNPTYAPPSAGMYYCVATNGGCSSGPSNMLNITLLNVNTYNMSELSIFPNPTNGLLTLDWNGKAVNMKVDVYNSVGQGLMHETISNTTRKVLDLSHFASGTYFVVLHDADGNTGTARVTLTK